MIWAFDGKIGGVGKSIGAATCIERHASLGEFAVIEADVNNNVGRYAEGLAKKVWLVNILASSGWLDLATAIADESCPEVVLSLPAGSDTVGHAEILRDVLTDTGRRMALVWMMNRTSESVVGLSKVIAAFADSPVTVIPALNLFFGAEEKFKIWNGSKTRATFLKGGGFEMGRVVEEIESGSPPVFRRGFPELDDTICAETFGVSPKVRFSEATIKDYGYRWDLARWLEKTAALYAGVAEKMALEVINA
jgi:hypothetical protein